jgi:hypothetical protein
MGGGKRNFHVDYSCNYFIVQTSQYDMDLIKGPIMVLIGIFLLKGECKKLEIQLNLKPGFIIWIGTIVFINSGININILFLKLAEIYRLHFNFFLWKDINIYTLI